MSDALKFGFGFPHPSASAQVLIGPGLALNASNTQLEFIFQAFEAATIARLWYRHISITGASPVYQISLQGVDGSGFPDGTIKASGNAKATFTPTAGNNNTGQWINLTSSYTCTRGELLAIVISYSSGTINTSNFVTFTESINSSEVFPYYIENVTGTRTRKLGTMIYGYGSASLAYGNPVTNVTTDNYDDATNPDEVALRFIVPATWCSSYKIAGARALLGYSAVGSTLSWTLYDGTTAIQSYTADSDYAQGGNLLPSRIYFTDATLATLTPGNVYRLAFKNNHATTTNGVLRASVQSNADWAALPGGIEWYQSTRNNAGAWTDTNTSRPYLEPIFSDIAAPAAKPMLVDMQGGMAA
jgi:hypothetical protein